MQDYDYEDWFISIVGVLGMLCVLALFIALIYSAFNPPQCPEGLIYVPRLDICMEGVKPL
jgi:hypothetical protein